MGKGSAWERKLVNTLRDEDYPTARIGASGAGTDDDLPDLITSTPWGVFVIEAKYRATPYVALTDDEIEALKRFARYRTVTPLVAFKTDGRSYSGSWKAWKPEELNKTNGGNYSITGQMWSKRNQSLLDMLDGPVLLEVTV